MKKFLFAAIAAMVLSSYGVGHNSYAQTYINPALPEFINPPPTPAGAAAVRIVPHLSCYSSEYVDFQAPGVMVQKNNLYIWSWGAINSGGSSSGIAWKRTDMSGAIINADYILLDNDIMEPEIAFIQAGPQTIVFLAYYSPGAPGIAAGHYYNMYSWDNTTLTLLTTQPLPGATSYSRISIDAHNLDKVAIAWQTSTGIRVQLISSAGGALAYYPFFNIPGTFSGSNLPDIALAQPIDDPLSVLVRVAYVDAPFSISGFFPIRVISQNFNSLATAGGTIAWNIDDPAPVSLYYDPSATTGFGNDGNYLELDCPDNGSMDWSFLYSYTSTELKARVKSEFVDPIMPYDIDIVDGIDADLKSGLAISYDVHSNKIHYGWANRGPDNNYLDVTYLTDFPGGQKIGAPDEYKIIQNSGKLAKIPLVTYSKQQSPTCKNLFAVYITEEPTSSGLINQLRTKVQYYPISLTFRSPIKLLSSHRFVLYANPSSVAPQIANELPASYEDVYTLSISNNNGIRLKSLTGTPNSLNTSLPMSMISMSSGIYYLRIGSASSGYSETLKFTKL